MEQRKQYGARIKGATAMCEYYGLPLALIFEELVDMDKPEDKAQELRPAEAEQEQQNKGERQK